MSDAQRLPNLYQLLGLNGLESNREKIAAALKRAQAKADTLKADSARAADLARLQKVIALGQKYLLSPALKSNYDAQWSTIYGQADASPAAVPAEKLTAKSLAAREEPVVASVATTALPKSTADSSHQTHELFWDMAALDALLPPADPHEPFQMADYLRTSQVRDPMAAEADLRKLIALLGGEDLPASEQAASPSAPSQVFIGNERPTQFDAPGLSSAGLSSAGLSMPRSSSNTTAVGLAKRMRQKRQQAMLFGGTMLVAALGGLIVLAFYLNRPTPKPAEALAQTPKVPEPKLLDRNSSPDIAPATDPSSQLNDSSIAGSPASNTPLPNPSGLIQPGQNKPLEIQATPMKPDAMATSTSPAEAMKPEAMKPEPAKPDPAKPDPAKPDPAKPDPAKPDPAKPDPAKPDPAKPDPAKPDPTKPEPAKPDAKPETKPDAEPPADVKLSTRERRSWQEDMKRARAALSKLDPVASEKQLAQA